MFRRDVRGCWSRGAAGVRQGSFVYTQACVLHDSHDSTTVTTSSSAHQIPRLPAQLNPAQSSSTRHLDASLNGETQRQPGADHGPAVALQILHVARHATLPRQPGARRRHEAAIWGTRTAVALAARPQHIAVSRAPQRRLDRVLARVHVREPGG